MGRSATPPIQPSSSFFTSNPIPNLLPPFSPKFLTTLSLKIYCSQSTSNQPRSLISILRSVPDWTDAVKERGMRKNRLLYNHEKWVDHRSSARHLRHMMSSLSSRVILSLIPPVIVFTSFAVIVASYNSAIVLGILPEILPPLRASPLPYQLTAPALALLLVFRTEASYSRLLEGRKAWTKVISGTCDFAKQVIVGVQCPSDAPLKKALLQYTLAFPVALKCHVLYGSDIRKELQDLLEADDLDIVLSSNHRPSCIIGFMFQSIQLLNLDESKRTSMETGISYFYKGVGVCDELIAIPLPLSYTRLTSRFLVFWHLTLPIILWDDCNWVAVPATFISAASLFCIEEVGVLIEEPFPMLPLAELCKKVHSDIRESMMTEKSIRAAVNAKTKRCSSEHSSNGFPIS